MPTSPLRPNELDVYKHSSGIEVAVPDPYRWLEDPDSKETVSWVDSQVALTKGYFGSCKDMDNVLKKMEGMVDYEVYSSTAWRVGNVLFYHRNEGLQDQDVECLLMTNCVNNTCRPSTAYGTLPECVKHCTYCAVQHTATLSRLAHIAVDTLIS